MFFNIIFQLHNENSNYLGKYNINLLNYGIHEYIENSKKSEGEELITINSYITKILDKCLNQINKQINPYKLIILNDFTTKSNNQEQINFDIEINESDNQVKIFGTIIDSKIFLDMISELNANKIKYFDTDFIESDLEYTYDYNSINKMVWAKYNSTYYPNGYDSDLEVDDAGFNEVVEQEKLEKELLEKHTDINLLTTNISDAQYKIKIYKHLISTYYRLFESVFVNEIKKKILTQYTRIFKNMDYNTINIKYNWRVTYINKEKYGYEGYEISIGFECDHIESVHRLTERINKKKIFEGSIEQIYNHEDQEFEITYKTDIENLSDDEYSTYRNLIKYLCEKCF